MAVDMVSHDLSDLNDLDAQDSHSRVARALREANRAVYERTRTERDKLGMGSTVSALLLSALGVMCPPLSLVGVAVALLWRYGDRRGPSLGVQYARWAVVMGLLALAAGSAGYYGMFRMMQAVQKDVEATTEHGPKKP